MNKQKLIKSMTQLIQRVIVKWRARHVGRLPARATLNLPIAGEVPKYPRYLRFSKS